MIRKGDLVLHLLSGLYFICENSRHERWMNENRFYQKVPDNTVPLSYHLKNIGKQ